MRILDSWKYQPFSISGLPLWLVRLVYNGRRLTRALNVMHRYPLADPANSLSCQPLIIVSAGRSGTTLLRSMLVVGEQIAIPPEGHVLGHAIMQYSAMQDLSWRNLSRLVASLFEDIESFALWETDLRPVYPRLNDLPARERSLARIIDMVYRQYASDHFPQARLWGEQTPSHTLFLPWLMKTFPNAKYLHVLRDGRDTVASWVERGYALKYSTRLWQTSVSRAMKAAQQLPSDQFMEIRYENLVTDAVTTLQNVCAFAGIDYTGRMLEYWKSPTTVEHKFFNIHKNLAQPVFTSSIGRWTERLDSNQQQYVLRELHDLLKQLHYIE